MISLPPDVLSDDANLATAIVTSVLLGLFEEPSRMETSIESVAEIVKQLRAYERTVVERGRRIAAELNLDGGESDE